MTGYVRLIIYFLLFAFPLTTYSINATTEAHSFHSPLVARLVNEENTVQPGRPFWIAINLTLDKEWHAYWKNPGDAGMALSVSWDQPNDFHAEEFLWPTPQRFNLDTAVGFGYEKEATLLAKITLPEDYKDNSVFISGTVRWVVCSDSTCLPGDSPIAITIPVTSEPPMPVAKNTSIFTEARAHLPQPGLQFTAERKAGLIEIGISEKEKITQADFFPENHQGINYKIHPLIESDGKGKNKIILKEEESRPTLNGVLILHTNSGALAYQINGPITGSTDEVAIATGNTIPNKTNDADELEKPSPPPSNSFEFQGGFLLALIFAFTGGMILNLMPCVLPVISFKILSFVKLAGKSRKLIFEHGLLFSLGVLVSFWVLAGLLLILQAYGESVGWGFQLQEPLFVGILAATLFLFSLSLFGIFEIGTSVMAAAGEMQQKSNGLTGSFLSGILATLVATPCTGPFLGTSVGYAVTLPPAQAMLIFTFLGLGMSFPYLLLSSFPQLLRFIPKPGPWMVTFKELMGFLMLGSTVWLAWVFSAETSGFALSLLLGAFFWLALAAWIYGRWCTLAHKKAVRLIAMIIAAFFLCVGSYTIFVASSEWAEEMGALTASNRPKGLPKNWETFSPERVAELNAQGIPVFIDFTAKWCLICQANHVILSKDEVEKKFDEAGVVRMKADWTKRDAVIAAELKKYGRNSVPLYLLYSSDGNVEPEVLPQVLTPETVLESLDKIKTSK